MPTFLEESKKRARSVIFEQIPIIWYKDREIGPVDPKIIVSIKEKEINASKIYSQVGKCAEQAKKLGRHFHKPRPTDTTIAPMRHASYNNNFSDLCWRVWEIRVLNMKATAPIHVGLHQSTAEYVTYSMNARLFRT